MAAMKAVVKLFGDSVMLVMAGPPVVCKQFDLIGVLGSHVHFLELIDGCSESSGSESCLGVCEWKGVVELGWEFNEPLLSPSPVPKLLELGC